MESDSTYSAIALAVSLAIFLIATVSESCLVAASREKFQRLDAKRPFSSDTLSRLLSMPLGPAGAVSILKTLSFAAALLSTVALANAQDVNIWFVASSITVIILAAAALTNKLARVLADAQGGRVALLVSFPVRIISLLMYPALLIGEYVKTRIGPSRTRSANEIVEELSNELELDLEQGGPPLDEHEVRMIRGVVRLDKTSAREIMIPRMDMVVADQDAPMSELAELMISGNHSRIPVFKGDLDHIEGIAYARDILRHLVQGVEPTKLSVQSVTRPALFIPESKTLEELLNEFQDKRVHMAIVVDEYGGISGLVTIEDLLEEIVGEIQDEFDVGEPEIESISDDEYIVDARLGIDQLNDLMNVSVEGDGYDTLGGFVYERLGKIPSPGDSLDHDGLRIEVITTVGRRLKKLKVTRS